MLFLTPFAQVSFNDPKVKLVRNVESAEELKSGLDELDYKGGLDIEEQAFRGETSRTLINFQGSNLP